MTNINKIALISKLKGKLIACHNCDHIYVIPTNKMAFQWTSKDRLCTQNKGISFSECNSTGLCDQCSKHEVICYSVCEGWSDE